MKSSCQSGRLLHGVKGSLDSRNAFHHRLEFQLSKKQNSQIATLMTINLQKVEKVLQAAWVPLACNLEGLTNSLALMLRRRTDMLDATASTSSDLDFDAAFTAFTLTPTRCQGYAVLRARKVACYFHNLFNNS